MSAVVGVDLSSRALDLVKLDESTNRAEWVRCELEGPDAWARTLTLRDSLPGPLTSDFFEDVYLVAIEAPYGRGQAGTLAVLNRVVGVVAASLPRRLRVPERCWLVAPHEWKNGLGLKGKPSDADVDRLAPGWTFTSGTCVRGEPDPWQNARDAYCLALWARTENAKGVAA